MFLESRLFDNIPKELLLWSVIVLCIGATILSIWHGLNKGLRYTALLALMEYVGLIYCSTVFFRNTNRVLKYNWHPFWSYQAIEAGKDKLLSEIIMNVVMFVPIGLLMGCAFRIMNWKLVLVIGCILSVGIELFQFLLKRGFSEFDDVMHNTLGCMIGYGLFSLIRYGYKWIPKRRMAVL